MIFPSPLPDEIFCSLLARAGRINGFPDYRDMVTSCGGGPTSSFIDAEIDLSMFCHEANSPFRGVEELLQNLTWYDAQVRVGEMDRLRLEALVNGNVRLTLGRSMFPDSAVLGYCPTCRIHDFQQYGMTYWHRLHQLPIVFFCPHHGDRVVRMRVKRYTLHKEFPVPGDFESGLNDTEPIFGLNERFWQGVAAMAADALQDDDLPAADTISSILADELLQRKFVPRLSGVRLTVLTEQLAVQAFENPSCSSSREIASLLKRVAHSYDEPAAEMPLGRVALLYWLFGGWKAAKERCRWLSVIGSVSDFSMRKAVENQTKPEAQYRLACTAYIREHPESTRLDFMKAEYRCFRWLRHNDKAWLDRKLPVPYRGGRQLALL